MALYFSVLLCRWCVCVCVDVKPCRFLYLLKVKKSWLSPLAAVPKGWQRMCYSFARMSHCLFCYSKKLIVTKGKGEKILQNRKNTTKQIYRPLCTIFCYQIYKQPHARTSKSWPLGQQTARDGGFGPHLHIHLWSQFLLSRVPSLVHPKFLSTM